MKLKNALNLSKNSNRGVSPVIGVILMVVITVILAGVVAFGFMGFGDQVNENPPQASFDSSYETTTATITHTTGDSIDASNVQVFIGNGNGQDIGSGELSAGSTIDIEKTDGAGDPAPWNGEEIRVVYDDGQGNSQTLYTDTAPVKESPVPSASFDFTFNDKTVDITHTGSETVSASDLKVYVDSTEVSPGISGDISNGDTFTYDNGAYWSGETVKVEYDGEMTETLGSSTAGSYTVPSFDATFNTQTVTLEHTSGDDVSVDDLTLKVDGTTKTISETGTLSTGDTITHDNGADWSGETVTLEFTDSEGNTQTLVSESYSYTPTASFDTSFGSSSVTFTHTGGDSIDRANLQIYVDGTATAGGYTGMMPDEYNTISANPGSSWDGETVTLEYDNGVGSRDVLKTATAPESTNTVYETNSDFQSIEDSGTYTITNDQIQIRDGSFQSTGMSTGADEVTVEVNYISGSGGAEFVAQDSSGSEVDSQYVGSSGSYTFTSSVGAIEELYVKSWSGDEFDINKITVTEG